MENEKHSKKIKDNLKEIKYSLENIYSDMSSEDFGWVDDLTQIINIFTRSEHLHDFKDLIESILKSIDNSKKDETNKTKIKELKFLLNRVREKNPDFLLEKILFDGFSNSKSEGIKKSIQSQFYKLSQLVRLGKREEVMGILLIAYNSNKEKFPKSLIKTLKKEYDDDMFKAFMYAFLSNFIDTSNENNNSKGEG